MSSDRRGKRYSHPQIIANLSQPFRRQAFSLLHSHQRAPSSPPDSPAVTPASNQTPTSQLQIFKNRFIKALQPQQPTLGPSRRQVARDLEEIGVTSLQGRRDRKSRHPAEQMEAGPKQSTKQRGVKTVHNFFSDKKSIGRICEEDVSEGVEGEGQFQDEKFRKSRSIMIIRRLVRKRQVLAQQQREHFQVEFLRKRQVPIHHTQFHFNTKSKTEASSPCENRSHLKKTNRAIKDILRLQEALRQQQLEDQQQEPVICTKYVNYQSKSHSHTQPYLPGKRGNMDHSFRQKRQKKEEQGELGPWKRSPTNDFQAFL